MRENSGKRVFFSPNTKIYFHFDYTKYFCKDASLILFLIITHKANTHKMKYIFKCIIICLLKYFDNIDTYLMKQSYLLYLVAMKVYYFTNKAYYQYILIF